MILNVQVLATLSEQMKARRALQAAQRKTLGERAAAAVPIMDALQDAEEKLAKAEEEMGKRLEGLLGLVDCLERLPCYRSRERECLVTYRDSLTLLCLDFDDGNCLGFSSDFLPFQRHVAVPDVDEEPVLWSSRRLREEWERRRVSC